MNEADIAQAQMEVLEQANMRYRKPVDKIQANGICHNPSCELDVPPGHLFCNGGCGDMYELMKKKGMIKH
ncbi:MAG: hypothetical protein IBX55_01400 [Methyloprofundus sp.]|nr:hypothetical protein [Methyloprofundus sp.]